ncbi:hypothetical protein LAV73_12535, partial [Lysinibacillus xylanilyticus]|uniref:hypothetical protein n=1 Tax=Lysinibacillus xylanilyticus TaxID=582475 RepID=UPI002B250B1C
GNTGSNPVRVILKCSRCNVHLLHFFMVLYQTTKIPFRRTAVAARMLVLTSPLIHHSSTYHV